MTTLGELRIKGAVRKGGQPVEGAYITLNNADAELIAERRTGPDGFYEFHISPGKWTLICRAADSDAATHEINAEAGELEDNFDL